jgi:uncharacterized repeat protein (TIGR01451 family)
MTKARAFTIAGLIHLTVATLLATTLLFGGPGSAVGSEMIITDTPTEPNGTHTPTPHTITPPPPPPICKLKITKTANATELWPGETVTFVIQVCNAGDKTCEDVVVSDALPDELEVVSASASLGQAIIEGNGVRAEFGDLLPKECAELTIVARVRDDVELCTQFTNVATIGDDVISNLVTLTVPCPLPKSGETAVQRGKVASQVVVVGLLVIGVGLVATGLALRARSGSVQR